MINSPEWVVERKRILETLDLDAVRGLYPAMTTNFGLLIAMHKARVDAADIARELRLLSVEWLRAHGYRRNGGLPLPKPGELPE